MKNKIPYYVEHVKLPPLPMLLPQSISVIHILLEPDIVLFGMHLNLSSAVYS